MATLFSSLTQAAVIPFTDEEAWREALGETVISTQTFTGESINFQGDTNGNPLGVFSVDLLGGVDDSGPTGLTGSGFFQGEVDAGTSSPLRLRFHTPLTYGFSILGLQNDSTSNSASLHLEEIGIAVGNQQWLISDILGLSAPGDGLPVPNTPSVGSIDFLGFVSDQTFEQFHIIAGEDVRDVSGSTEEFFIAGFQYASIFPEPQNEESISVPEPSSVVLLGLGMMGLFCSRNRTLQHQKGNISPKTA